MGVLKVFKNGIIVISRTPMQLIKSNSPDIMREKKLTDTLFDSRYRNKSWRN